MSDPRKLLDELYALDPSCKAHEDTLLPLLERLVAAKPTVTLTPHFLHTLRNRLMFEPSPVTKRTFPIRGLTVAAAFSVLAVLVAIPASQYLNPGSPAITPSGIAISRLSNDAFGTLTASQAVGGMGGGGNVARSATTMATEDRKIAGIAVGEYYPSTKYVYGYDGEFTLPGATGTVYKRTAGLQLPSALAQSIAATNLGLIDLGEFTGLQAQHLTMRENDPNGYSVSIDMHYGTVYMSVNEGYWSRITNTAPLTEAEIPSEAEIIAAAERFLKQYGITTDGYGEPTINNVQYMALLDAARTSAGYVQDTMNVTWPMLVNGTPVLNNDGSGYGLSATVSLRTKEVTNASIISATAVDASIYNLTTDTARVLDVVARGGLWGWQPETADTTVHVALGAPELVLTLHSTWNTTTNRSEELYVPALSFPITNEVEGIYQSHVVVPLAEDILNSVTTEPVYRILEEGEKVDPAPSEMIDEPNS